MTNNKIEQHIKYCLPLKAEELLYEAFKFYNKDVEIAVSFGAEDVVLIDMVSRLNIDIGIFTIDTQRLNDETYDLMKEIKQKYNIKIEILYPNELSVKKMIEAKGINLFYDSVENRKECCGVRKVAPLRSKLAKLDAWITGQRQDQSITRGNVPLREEDTNFAGSSAEGQPSALIKFNPLSEWTSADVWNYIREHEVPYNALHDQGFVSIGCQPCTRSVGPFEHERAGRWWWEEATKKECGLHSQNMINVVQA